MNNAYQKIIKALERQTIIEKAILMLRSLDFRFLESTSSKLHIAEEYQKYSWLLRKKGFNTWDGTLMIGIKMWGKKSNKVLIMFEGELHSTLKIPWKDKADINFRKLVVKLKFPETLNYEERRTWRTEHHKQIRNPKRIPTQWYLKYLPDVQFL